MSQVHPAQSPLLKGHTLTGEYAARAASRASLLVAGSGQPRGHGSEMDPSLPPSRHLWSGRSSPRGNPFLRDRKGIALRNSAPLVESNFLQKLPPRPQPKYQAAVQTWFAQLQDRIEEHEQGVPDAQDDAVDSLEQGDLHRFKAKMTFSPVDRWWNRDRPANIYSLAFLVRPIERGHLEPEKIVRVSLEVLIIAFVHQPQRSVLNKDGVHEPHELLIKEDTEPLPAAQRILRGQVVPPSLFMLHVPLRREPMPVSPCSAHIDLLEIVAKSGKVIEEVYPIAKPHSSIDELPPLARKRCQSVVAESLPLEHVSGHYC